MVSGGERLRVVWAAPTMSLRQTRFPLRTPLTFQRLGLYTFVSIT